MVATVLGMTLGGIGYVGYFFWEYRSMCPCAPVGLPGVEVSLPSLFQMRWGIVISSAFGATFAFLISVVLTLPTALRLKKVFREIEES